MADWKSAIAEKGILISDGAWGTQFFQRGMTPGEAPERLNLENPQMVREVAASYVKAGSDIILTNTFGGSPFKLKKTGLGEKVFEANKLGAALSKDAAGDDALVFASIGPTGDFMAPLGPISEQQMTEGFALQVKGLEAGGADGIVIETMTDLGEAKAALKAVRENTRLPVVVSMSFQKAKDSYATIMGVRPEQAATELEAAGADMVGANCGEGIDVLLHVVRLMQRATSLPIWLKPNAGLPKYVAGKTIYEETPESMAGHLKEAMEAGVAVLGGCCGTSPEHVKAFVAAREKLGEGKPS